MTWIERKTTENWVPQIWLIKCTKSKKKNHKRHHKALENWKVELAAGSQNLAEVKIQRDIFRGHSLSPLLFVTAMMSPINIFRKYGRSYLIVLVRKTYG